MNQILDVKSQMHLLELEITTECNQNCQYCYNRNEKREEMSLDDVKNYFEFAKENNVEVIVISGGEASLHKDFSSICKYVLNEKNNFRRIVLQSNGNIKNAAIKDLKAFHALHLSYELDLTSVRSLSTEDNMELAKYFNEHGIYTYLFSTITMKNYKNIDKIIDKANSNNVDIAFNLCIDNGSNKDLLLSNKLKFEVCKKLVNYEKEGKILAFKNPFTSIIKNYVSEEFIGVKGGCTAGIASCVISSNGNVYPCPFFRIIAGNTKANDIKDIWMKSNILKLLRSRKFLQEPCGSCKHLSFCGGCRKNAFQASKSLLGSDPSCILNEVHI